MVAAEAPPVAAEAPLVAAAVAPPVAAAEASRWSMSRSAADGGAPVRVGHWRGAGETSLRLPLAEKGTAVRSTSTEV